MCFLTLNCFCRECNKYLTSSTYKKTPKKLLLLSTQKYISGDEYMCIDAFVGGAFDQGLSCHIAYV